jgi:hypothetical protein
LGVAWKSKELISKIPDPKIGTPKIKARTRINVFDPDEVDCSSCMFFIYFGMPKNKKVTDLF